ncbi:hypothetical protein H0H92_016124 [Tricholoma furcatifolium]|nr:hypothetical protein H0H92_016124 [Tricholoma furcatifolium]
MRLTSMFIVASIALSAAASPLPYGRVSYARRGGPLTPRLYDEIESDILARGNSLSKDEVPSAKKLKPKLRIDTDKALFYSGPGGYQEKARQYAKDHGNLQILEDSWKDPKTPEKLTKGMTAEQEKKFWDNASQAMTMKSKGKTTVLLPEETKGTNFYPGTVWDRVEWDGLKQNENVDTINKANPNNEHTEVIFDRKKQNQTGKKKRALRRSIHHQHI